jgi:hypothetical protein
MHRTRKASQAHDVHRIREIPRTREFVISGFAEDRETDRVFGSGSRFRQGWDLPDHTFEVRAGLNLSKVVSVSAKEASEVAGNGVL